MKRAHGSTRGPPFGEAESDGPVGTDEVPGPPGENAAKAVHAAEARLPVFGDDSPFFSFCTEKGASGGARGSRGGGRLEKWAEFLGPVGVQNGLPERGPFPTFSAPSSGADSGPHLGAFLGEK